MVASVPVWRMTVAGLSLVAVCYGLARFAYGLFVPEFRTEFVLSDTLLGTVAAGSYVGYCLAVLSSAAAVDRFGSRATAVAAGTAAASGMIMVALSPNVVVLAVGVLVAGTSTGLASPPFAEAIARRVTAAGHDRAQAVVNAGPGIGIAVSGLVALAALDNWRVAWLLFAVTAVLVTVLVAVTVPRPLPERRSRTGLSGLAAVTGARRSWRLVTGAALFGAVSSAVWAFGRDHVTRASELDQTGATLFWIVLGTAELIGVTAGDLVARWGLRPVWTACLTLLGLATITLGLFPSTLLAAFPAVAVFGSGYVILTTVVFLWATRLHPHHTAAGIAVGFLAIAAGQALASPLVGVLSDHFGTTHAFTVSATLSILVAGILGPHGMVAGTAATTGRVTPGEYRM